MHTVTLAAGNNKIYQICPDKCHDIMSTKSVLNSWIEAVSFVHQGKGHKGLRSAQLGALFSIKAHWTVSHEPATIVMPTGTGKTETMIATVVSEMIERTLIIVPSNLLRKQTASKFMTLGVLPEFGVIKARVNRPIVTALSKTPKEFTDLQLVLKKSNIIVTTMSLLQRFPPEYLKELNNKCSALIVDEAHHIAANTWATIKHQLKELPCLQFTATPFRNDGKRIDGKIIYNFPLSMAQNQGYFQKIRFIPLLEFDEEKGDLAIATAAVKQLEVDIKRGYLHVILVRAKSKSRANILYSEIYQRYFSKYNPVLIHSDIGTADKASAMVAIKDGTAKIVVCVDMFGEGIDIPNLKIAAVHDKYLSLPITLQFIGRFARVSDGLGSATVITNIANDDLNDSLKELYAQDSDWNVMLNIMSDKAIGKELSLQGLAEGFNSMSLHGMTIQQLRPKISMIAYSTDEKAWRSEAWSMVFNPDNCYCSVNEDSKIMVIIERENTNIDWTSFKGINDTNWQLHLIYWNPDKKMFFVNSTNKSIADGIAEALFPRNKRINGEVIFRCLHGIKRLMLGTVGLKSAIDGPIRYRMFAGIDIANGIAESQKGSSIKSNLFGMGYNGNGKVSIGCSYKGSIWSKWVESIDYWKDWCNTIADRLNNSEIDTSKIFEGALVPVVVNQRPNIVPYAIEWPIEMDLLNDNSIIVLHGDEECPIFLMDISLSNYDSSGPICFSVGNGTFAEEYELIILEGKFEFKTVKPIGLMVRMRKREYQMIEFFKKYPPRIKFIDQSMLEGNLLVSVKGTPPSFDKDRLIVWDWAGIDIRKESQGQQQDTQSIQYRVIKELISTNNYCVIFDDDDAGEIADVVGIIDAGKQIIIQLYHCKYSHGDKPGARVADLYEVCGQTEKSVKWCQDPPCIIDRLIKRESLRKQQSGGTRFQLGDLRKLKEIKNKMRVFPTKIEIFAVQPGVHSTKITDDMLRILGASASYLLDTYSIKLKIICS